MNQYENIIKETDKIILETVINKANVAYLGETKRLLDIDQWERDWFKCEAYEDILKGYRLIRRGYVEAYIINRIKTTEGLKSKQDFLVTATESLLSMIPSIENCDKKLLDLYDLLDDIEDNSKYWHMRYGMHKVPFINRVNGSIRSILIRMKDLEYDERTTIDTDIIMNLMKRLDIEALTAKDDFDFIHHTSSVLGNVKKELKEAVMMMISKYEN